MKRILLLLLLFNLPGILAAQIENPPNQEEEETASWGKMGGGGGFIPIYFVPSLKDINTDLTQVGMPDFGSRGMIMYGGGGFAYVNLVRNMRIGGMGAGGSIDLTSTAKGIKRESTVGVGLGGLTVEYVVPVHPKVDLAFGATIGGGKLSLRLARHDDATKNWDQDLNELKDAAVSHDIIKEYGAPFFFVRPTACVEVHLYSWLGLRLGGGYYVSAPGSWSSNGFDAAGLPSSFKAKGLSLEAGLFIGSFFDNP